MQKSYPREPRFLLLHSSFGQKESWFWPGCKPNSVCALRRRESFVSATDTRNLPLSRTRSGPLLGFLFGLAPDGVFRAVSLALHAVRSYRTFSPLPTACAAGGLIFCGTVRRKVFQLSACVYPSQTSLGYAASRPMEFGLSSPDLRPERFSALPKPSGTYTKIEQRHEGFVSLRAFACG